MAATGEPTGTALSTGRDARAAAVEPPRLMLGDATGRAGVEGSRVGNTMRGRGVESGIVSATVSVAVTAGEPPTVTTRYAPLPSPDFDGVLWLPVAESRSAHPVVTSSARPAVMLIQRLRRMSGDCCDTVPQPEQSGNIRACLRGSTPDFYSFQRLTPHRVDNLRQLSALAPPGGTQLSRWFMVLPGRTPAMAAVGGALATDASGSAGQTSVS